MIFLGRTFCSGKYTLDTTPTNVDNITSLTLQNGIFDEIFITKDVAYVNDGTIQTEWNYDTIIHAYFNGNLQGGNSEYSVSQVSSLRIKRRRKNTYNWITLFEIPVTTPDDFKVERYDRFARGNKTEYDYAIVPVLNGTEGNMNINSIISDFEGVYILEKEKGYGTVLDAKIDGIQRNSPSAVITTIDSQYPYTVSNGNANYSTGNITGTFIELDKENCEWKINESHEYREDVVDLLSNKKSKIIKDDRGRIKLVKMLDGITETINGHPDYVSVNANWVENGNAESSKYLYEANLIDVNVEGV